jgi:hypothetical protein
VNGEGICLGAGLMAKGAAIVERLEVVGLAKTVQVHGLVGEWSKRRDANVLRNGENTAAVCISSSFRVIEDRPVLQGQRHHRHRE